MTKPWHRHAIIAVRTASLSLALALSACDGAGKDADLSDVPETCGCPDLGGADVPVVADAAGDNASAPADSALADPGLADTLAPDAPADECAACDASPFDVPVTDAPGSDPAGTDDSTGDTTSPDPAPADVPPDDPGLPPATLGVVSAAALLAQLEHKDFLLVNVHIPDAGQIPGTDIHISYQQIDAIAAYLGTDLDVKAVLYCWSNSMSTNAGQKLVARGYRNLRYLDGGMYAWKNAGYPFEATPP